MKVLAYDPFLDEKTIAERNATKVELDDINENLDAVGRGDVVGRQVIVFN